jgi:hypothetical protein
MNIDSCAIQPSWSNHPRLSLIVAVTLLGGCATSRLPSWEPVPTASGSHITLSEARTYAQRARGAYVQALDSEVSAQSNLGNTLIGVGTLTAGLAAFKAHRDAVIGAALLGGSGYAFGQWNISRQRQLVYIAGMDAINCAVAAANPFDASDEDRRTLRDALGALETELTQYGSGIDAVTAEAATLPQDDTTADERAGAAAAVAAANKLADDGRQVLAGGRQAVVKLHRIGGELIAAVDRIGNAVNRAVLETIPDLAAIPKVVGALGTYAGHFAPSAALDTHIQQRFAAYAPTSAGTGDRSIRKPRAAEPSQRLATAISTLQAASTRLGAKITIARSLAMAYDAPPAGTALANCGVTISFPLAASPASLTLKGKVEQTYTIVLRGGTKPYSVQQQGALPAGVTVKAPIPFDSAITVTTTNALEHAKSFSLLVLDSANPPNAISVEVASDAAPPAQANSESTSDAPQERRGAQRQPHNVSPEELRIVQSRLCMAAEEIDGKWGPKTLGAVNAWREKTSRRASDTALSRTEADEILKAPAEKSAGWCK